jgi:hypothetical protein
MSLWELRQVIESAFPWWSPLVVIGTVIVVFLVTVLIERRPKE